MSLTELGGRRRLVASWFGPLLTRPDESPRGSLPYDARALGALRRSSAYFSIVIHLVMWATTHKPLWLLVAVLGVVHALVVIPVTALFAYRRTATSDLVAVMCGTFIVGDPVPAVFWAPAIMMAGLVFDTTDGSLATNGKVAAVLALVFGADQLNLLTRPMSRSELVLYSALATMNWIIVMAGSTFLVGTAFDRRAADLAATQSELEHTTQVAVNRTKQIETILETVPLGVAFQDEVGEFLFTNQLLLDMLDLHQETIATEGAVNTVEPDKLREIEALIEYTRANATPTQIEYTLRGGRRIIHHIRHAPTVDGKPGTVSAMQDVTVERQMSRRLRRFSSAVEASPDLVVMWAVDGTILHANRAFVEFWQLEGSPAGRNLGDVIGDECRQSWTDLGTRSPGRTFEVQAQPQTGVAVPLSILVQCDTDEDTSATVFTAVARDITEMVAARHALEDVIRAKDEFIASVSHELRTPLSAVLGLAAEIAQNTSDFAAEEIRELAGIIAEQANEVGCIVQDLLMAARADAGALTIKLQIATAEDLVSNALRSLATSLASTIRTDIPPDLAIYGDPARIHQIIRNLLTNAHRYGGPDLLVTARRSGEMAEIEVSDDGPPIPKEKRKTMFEAYGRAHTRSGRPESVGLGLHVSRTLARLMDGDVTYQHAGGRSRFTITIPQPPAKPTQMAS